MTDYAIETNGLSVYYGQHRGIIDVDLRVEQGEVFGFLGPNGAGKTTTIKMIVSLLRPNTGSIHVCGHAVGVDGLAAKAELAYVPDQPFLYEKLTGREFLHFVAEMYAIGPEHRDRKLISLVEQLNIGEYLDHVERRFDIGRPLAAAALRLLALDQIDAALPLITLPGPRVRYQQHGLHRLVEVEGRVELTVRSGAVRTDAAKGHHHLAVRPTRPPR